ncbi:MAG: IS1595 family transposase [Acidobacteriia bacterium]|nr:IS1595 family transposase [Terriglobia bacterium]
MNDNLTEMIEKYGSEDKCRAHLEQLRWPNGVECPRCKATQVSHIHARHQYDCDKCRYQFSVLTGTGFSDTHLPIWKWFLAAYLICESRKGVSANQIKRVLGISYKSAWFLCHRIRNAMKETNPAKLTGTVEIDETYIGGELPHSEGGMYDNKSIVLGMRQRQGNLRMVKIPNAKARTLRRSIVPYISRDVERVITDERSAYIPAIGPLYPRKLKRIRHAEKYVDGDIHTNTVENAFSLLKRAAFGTYHKLSDKHLQSYLDEMTFRFNRREDPNLFSETLSQLLTTKNLTFEELTAD